MRKTRRKSSSWVKSDKARGEQLQRGNQNERGTEQT
jgi:hypothetical protein